MRRLQAYLFIIFHVQPISQGVTLLFFFAEKKKEAKKKRVRVFLVLRGNAPPEDYTPTKLPRRGIQAAAAAVTLPFLQLKLGRKVSGGLLSLSKSAVAISAGRRADSPPQRENIALKIAHKKQHRTKSDEQLCAVFFEIMQCLTCWTASPLPMPLPCRTAARSGARCVPDR